MATIMQCEKMVLSNGLNFAREHQCKNNAIACVDGHHFCNTHDPERIKKAEAEKQIKRDKRQNELRAIYLSKFITKNKK